MRIPLDEGVRLFDAYPLSPIHVGSGEKLSLDDYVLEGSTLIRFNASAALGALPPAEAAKYIAAVDQNRFTDATKILTQTAARFPLYQVPMGPESAQELSRAVQAPHLRTGDVWALQRNAVSGSVVIPGSAVKGAIRTALLSARLPEGEAARLKSMREREADQELRQIAFEATARETEKDPLRALQVSDTEIGAGRVRVDRARSVKRNGEPDPMFQMHFERLISQVDNEPWSFRLRMRLSGNATTGLRKLQVRRPVTWEEITQACREFFFARVRSDAERFEGTYSDYIEQELQGKGPSCIPLRIGRFSHFESLSVEKARNQRGRDGRSYTCGSSRTLCQIGDRSQSAFVPFGWLLLAPA